MKIRRAKSDDAIEISQLKKKTIAETNKEYGKKQLSILRKDYSVNNIKRDIRNREMFCLFDKGEILGVIDFNKDRIGGLFIKHDLIRKGYGKKLLSFIEDYSKNNGIKKVWLYSTPYAVNFYLKQGFRIVSKEIWINKGVNFPEVKMEKFLK